MGIVFPYYTQRTRFVLKTAAEVENPCAPSSNVHKTQVEVSFPES